MKPAWTTVALRTGTSRRTKLELLQFDEALAIDTHIGPLAGEHTQLVSRHHKEIANQNLRFNPTSAARTHRNDIIPIVEFNSVGIPLRLAHSSAVFSPVFCKHHPRQIIEDD